MTDTPTDRYDLNRFLEAQKFDYERAVLEIRSGRKQTHWIWYVFPQIDGLGQSSTAKRYALNGMGEAREYLHHPVLGPRLTAIADDLLAVEGKSITEIVGYPDDLKVRSCATLFALVSDEESVFHKLLDKYYDKTPDWMTVALSDMDT